MIHQSFHGRFPFRFLIIFTQLTSCRRFFPSPELHLTLRMDAEVIFLCAVDVGFAQQTDQIGGLPQFALQRSYACVSSAALSYRGPTLPKPDETRTTFYCRIEEMTSWLNYRIFFLNLGSGILVSNGLPLAPYPNQPSVPPCKWGSSGADNAMTEQLTCWNDNIVSVWFLFYRLNYDSPDLSWHGCVFHSYIGLVKITSVNQR
jgi:hypothetical protein